MGLAAYWWVLLPSSYELRIKPTRRKGIIVYIYRERERDVASTERERKEKVWSVRVVVVSY